MTALGFESTLFLTGHFNQCLRPLNQACLSHFRSTDLKCRVLNDQVGVRVGYTLESTTIDGYPTESVDFVGYPRYLVGY